MPAKKKKYGGDDANAVDYAGLKKAADYFSGKDASAYGEAARKIAQKQRVQGLYKDMAKKRGEEVKQTVAASREKASRTAAQAKKNQAAQAAAQAKKKASAPTVKPSVKPAAMNKALPSSNKKVPSLPTGVAGNAMFRKMSQSAPAKKKAGAAKVTPQKRLYGK